MYQLPLGVCSQAEPLGGPGFGFACSFLSFFVAGLLFNVFVPGVVFESFGDSTFVSALELVNVPSMCKLTAGQLQSRLAHLSPCTFSSLSLGSIKPDISTTGSCCGWVYFGIRSTSTFFSLSGTRFRFFPAIAKEDIVDCRYTFCVLKAWGPKSDCSTLKVVYLMVEEGKLRVLIKAFSTGRAWD